MSAAAKTHQPEQQDSRPPSTPLLPAHTSAYDPATAPAPASSQPPPSPVPAPAPTPSILNLYLASGAALLAAGVLFGVRLGNRQAVQLERDHPAPTSPEHAAAKPPPPITAQQRAAAFRATLGALGLGTALCGLLGAGLVWGVGRYWDVSDTKEFAVRMDRVVSEQRVRWLGSMTSSLPGQVAGLRASLGRTQLGGWIRDHGKVARSGEAGEMSPAEQAEVEQAVDFLKELEADYQRTVTDVGKRRQAQVEVAELDRSRKT